MGAANDARGLASQVQTPAPVTVPDNALHPPELVTPDGLYHRRQPEAPSIRRHFRDGFRDSRECEASPGKPRIAPPRKPTAVIFIEFNAGSGTLTAADILAGVEASPPNDPCSGGGNLDDLAQVEALWATWVKLHERGYHLVIHLGSTS